MKSLRQLRLSLPIMAGICAVWLAISGLEQSAAQMTTYTIGISPCVTTIQACIDLAHNGDNIIIPAKTYTESLTLTKAVSLIGAGKTSTIIRAATNNRVVTITGAVISNTTISHLTLTNGRTFLDSGGGVYVSSQAQVTLDNVIISNNFSQYSGGGLSNHSVVTLTNSVVSFNAALGAGGGGGISSNCFSGCRIYISDSTINNNVISGQPAYGAGLNNSTGSTAELVNVVIKSNSGVQGVGIANQETTSVMSLTNVTVAGNGTSASSQSNYSGILNFGVITATNSTITANGNLSVTTSGGIYNAGTNSSFVLRNTIIANNLGGNCSSGAILLVDDGGNLQFGPNTGCISLSGEIPSGDPKLVAVTNNGGPTETAAILSGSAAIDSAMPEFCPEKDQRGYARVGVCDSGAFEYGAAAPVPSTPTLLSPPDNTITTTQALTLAWIAGAGEIPTGYNIELNGAIITTTATTSATVLPVGAYSWRIRAYNEIDYSNWTEPWSIVVITPTLYLPLVFRSQ